jgi:hypothetical protein
MVQKDSYDFEAKKLYREKLRKFIARQYVGGKERRGLRVMCLPGPEALEITEVYDALGVQRHRIWGIERDAEAARQLRAHNLGIQVYEGDVGNFLRSKPDVQGRVIPQDERFDVVNLDFQSQLKDKEHSILVDVFNPFIHKPNFIIGTNFYGARESSRIQLSYRAELADFFTRGRCPNPSLDIKQLNIPKNLVEAIHTNDLDKLRSDCIVATFYGLMWGYRPEDVINRAGRAFKGQVERLGLDYEKVIANPNDYLEPLFNIGRENQALLEKTVFLSFPHLDFSERSWLSSFIEFSSAVMPLSLKDFFKGRYVSDNGAPMFFDFLRLDNVKGGFAHPALVTRRLDDGYEIGLKKLGDDYEKQYSFFTKIVGAGNSYFLADREEITAKKLGDKVREDLVAGLSEEEVMQKYELNPRQLGAHKAALSRINGNGGNGKKDGNGNLVRLSSEDEEAVAEFIASGVPNHEICETYGLTNMQVAARKAQRTRKMRGAV